MHKPHSYFQRQQLKQLVIECDVLRLSTNEALEYIREKSEGHLDVSESELFKTKHRVRDSIGPEIHRLRKHQTQFLHEYVFKRIYALEKLEQEEWKMYRENKNPYVKQNCLSELHRLTVTMIELGEVLAKPIYQGSSIYNNEKVLSELHIQPEQPESGYRDPQEKF